jgi:hypothetical protein
MVKAAGPMTGMSGGAVPAKHPYVPWQGRAMHRPRLKAECRHAMYGCLGPSWASAVFLAVLLVSFEVLGGLRVVAGAVHRSFPSIHRLSDCEGFESLLKKSSYSHFFVGKGFLWSCDEAAVRFCSGFGQIHTPRPIFEPAFFMGFN